MLLIEGQAPADHNTQHVGQQANPTTGLVVTTSAHGYQKHLPDWMEVLWRDIVLGAAC